MTVDDVDEAPSSPMATTLPLQSASDWVFTRQRQLDPTGSAPGVARRWVTAELTAAGLVDAIQDDRYDVLLCTSELINASLIADSTAMTLHLRMSDRNVVLWLVDDTDQTTQAFHEKRHAQIFVLDMFDAVALQWGIAHATAGRVLWVELAYAAVGGRSDAGPDTRQSQASPRAGKAEPIQQRRQQRGASHPPTPGSRVRNSDRSET